MLIRQGISHSIYPTPKARSERPDDDLHTPEAAQDHVSFDASDWDPTQSFATLKSQQSKGAVVLDGVRWGLNETGSDSADWTGRFDTTELDTKKVKDVFVGVVPFMKDKIAHSVLVFEFEEDSPIRNAHGETDNRLVLSVDARVKKGEAWSIKKGLKREYPLVYQLDSFGARVQRSNRQLGDRLILHKLDLNREEKTELIETALSEAVTPKENYHTTQNSCWTNVIDLLNRVTDDEQQIRKKSWLTLGLTNSLPVIDPVLAGSLLDASKLLAPGPGLVIQPDKARHGDKMVPETTNSFLRGISQSRWWTPGCTLGGAATGAAIGNAIGGVIPGIIGGILGASTASLVSREAKVRNNLTFTNAEQFYPKVGVFVDPRETKV